MTSGEIVAYSNLIIKIVRAVISGERFDWSKVKNVDFHLLYKVALFQRVTNIVAYAVAGAEDVPADIAAKFENQMNVNIYRETTQTLEIEALLADFEKAGLDAMPLKGYITKKLYPSADMRDSCDIDILIRTEQYEKLHEIMIEHGFNYKLESTHEYIYYIEPAMVVELHKTLVPEYNHDLYEYYGNGWKYARKVEGCDYIYEMSDEDFYLYNIVHCAKHYLNSGIGLRYIIDVYLLKEYLERTDARYINEQLEKLGLTRFHSIVRKLSEVWFGEEKYDELTRVMAANILISGDSGTEEQQIHSSVYRESANCSFRVTKLRQIFRAFFQSRENLSKRYTILNKYPILYPFVTVYRWFDVLINRRSHAKEYVSKHTMNNTEINKFAKHCEEIGLRRTL